MNSPLPQDLGAECSKAAGIMKHFIHGKGPVDQVIPPSIIANAKGICILTVVKIGFVWSGRAGSGLVVARLPNGTWSGPSAIGTAGMGFGGQIGGELTDFVMILNTPEAVRAFSQGGNVTLGGNISVAAGPVGRNAEASGTFGGGFTAVYSYSKTKGLFAGISLEGSAIIERKDTNADFYGRQISAKEILAGNVPPPPQAQSLYTALNLKSDVNHMIGDREDVLVAPPIPSKPGSYATPPVPPKPFGAPGRAPPPPPPRPSSLPTAIALYDFGGQQPTDLSFNAGDTVSILGNTADEGWLKGKCNGREGTFPANYVQMQ